MDELSKTMLKRASQSLAKNDQDGEAHHYGQVLSEYGKGLLPQPARVERFPIRREKR